jgi:hypothetical protein
MKIKAEHYAHMREAIAAIGMDVPRYRAALVAEGKAKDIDKRLRWDAAYAARLTPWICDNLYGYMDDTHIDTALRSIMRDIEEA